MLRLDLHTRFPEAFAIIGNFPYNISTQIVFQVLEHRDRCTEVVGMFQKEVADRIAAPPGSKVYGITSVLAQAWYTVEHLMNVEPISFDPPPKVRSAVIRMERNAVERLPCDEVLFFRVVKTAFNQRRKTLHNALKPLPELNGRVPPEFAGKRIVTIGCSSSERYLSTMLAEKLRDPSTFLPLPRLTALPHRPLPRQPQPD